MRKLALAAAAAGTVLALSGFASADPMKLAQAGVTVDVGPGHVDIGTPHHRRYWHRHRHWRAEDCKTVTIKERHGDRVVIKKIQRC